MRVAEGHGRDNPASQQTSPNPLFVHTKPALGFLVGVSWAYLKVFTVVPLTFNCPLVSGVVCDHAEEHWTR